MLTLGNCQLHHATGGSDGRHTKNPVFTNAVAQVQDFMGQQAHDFAACLGHVIDDAAIGAQRVDAIGVQGPKRPHLSITAQLNACIGIATQQHIGRHQLAELQRGLLWVRLVVQHAVKRVLRGSLAVVVVALVENQRQACHSLRDGLHTGIDGADALGRGRVDGSSGAQGLIRPPRIVRVGAAALKAHSIQGAGDEVHVHVSSHSLRASWNRWQYPIERSAISVSL